MQKIENLITWVRCLEWAVNVVYSIFDDHSPRATAATPTIILASMYRVKCHSSPEFSSECFSKAKVEKVVNPPQKPVDSSKIWFWVRKLLFAEKPNIIPIRKQPIILTIKVPKKKYWKWLLNDLEIIYLSKLPKPPPKKTSNNCFIFANYIFSNGRMKFVIKYINWNQAT